MNPNAERRNPISLGEANAEATYRNVLKFVRDLKDLQRRTWLHTQCFEESATESEIMHPLETVLENVMGKMAQRFVFPIVPELINDDEVAATGLLAGTQQSVPPPPHKRASANR